MDTYRLGSSEMVHAPGIVRWAINGYKFKKDRPAMLRVMKSWEVPVPALKALLSGNVEWHEELNEEGLGVVVFEA